MRDRPFGRRELTLLRLRDRFARGIPALLADWRSQTAAPLDLIDLSALRVPVRIVIWLLRDEDRGLVRGTDAALRPGQVFGALVVAAGIGLLGGYLASRRDSAVPEG